MIVDAKILVPGSAAGEIARLAAPLSLWGGFDPSNGKIIDRNHPNCGISLHKKIVAMPYARGSSSSSSTLLEAVRTGHAPSAFLLSKGDPILTIGALVAAELYGIRVPILVLDCDWELLSLVSHASFEADEGLPTCPVTLS